MAVGGVRRAARRAGIVVVSGALAAAGNAVAGRVFGSQGQVLWPWALGALALAVTGIALDARLSGSEPGGPRLRLADSRGRALRLGAVTLVDLGVHPSELVADVTASPYAPRAVDVALRARLADRRAGVVLLPAGRLAGASRTLAEAAAAVLGDAVLFAFAPDPRFGIGDLVRAAAAQVAHGCDGLLWLDETLDGQSAAQLAATEVPEGLRVAGVLDPDLLGEHTAAPGHVQQFLARVTVPQLGPLGAAGDEEREQAAGTDPRYARALSEHGDAPAMLGAVLVARSAVRKKLRGTTAAARDRIMVLRVAIDWQRAALPASLLLTRARLVGLAEVYLGQIGNRPQRWSTQRVEAALAAACELVEGLGHPLVESFVSGRTMHYRAYRLLTALAGELDVPVNRPVDPVFWGYLAGSLSNTQRRAAGEHLLRIGNALAASALLRGTSDLAPDTSLILGLAEYQAGQVDAARAWCSAAIDTADPYHAPRAMNNLGLLEKEQGNVAEARRWWLAAINTAHPDHSPVAMGSLGVLEKEQGDLAEARRWYRAAIDTHHPDQAPRSLYNLGLLEKEQGNLAEARRWWLAAIDTAHADHGPAAMSSLGALEKEQGDLAEARRRYRAAIDTHHPDHAPQAMNSLGVLEEEDDQLEHARRWWLAAISTGHADHAPRAMYFLGVLETEHGDPTEARRWYCAAIDTHHPDHAPRAMNNLGVLEARQSDPAEAQRWWSAAIGTAHPDHAPAAMHNLASLEYRQGSVRKARRWYLAAIDTGHPDHAPLAMLNLGTLENAAGNSEQAAIWFTRAEATGHPKQAPRARAQMHQLRESEQARAHMPYQSPDSDNQTPYIPPVPSTRQTTHPAEMPHPETNPDAAN